MENSTEKLPNSTRVAQPIKSKTGCLGSTMIIILILIFLLPMGIWMWRAYNRMVIKEEAVTKQWANVENVYQKRIDLVQNLVNTVKGMAEFEQSTLTNVIEARSKASSVNINADELNEENLAKFQEAQDEFSGALSRLMVVVEQYPTLQAVEGFKNLTTDLKGLENEILAQRNAFNEVAMDFNQYIRTFPRNIFASIFGFDKKAYFKAAEGADKAPSVNF